MAKGAGRLLSRRGLELYNNHRSNRRHSRGSKILFTKNFNGLVINQITNKIHISSEKDKCTFVSAEAGVIWHDLVLYCINKNLGGIENLLLIPGKVGAASI